MFSQHIQQLSFQMVLLLNNIFECNFMAGKQSIKHLWVQVKSANCNKLIQKKNFMFTNVKIKGSGSNEAQINTLMSSLNCLRTLDLVSG